MAVSRMTRNMAGRGWRLFLEGQMGEAHAKLVRKGRSDKWTACFIIMIQVETIARIKYCNTRVSLATLLTRLQQDFPETSEEDIRLFREIFVYE